MSVRTTVPVTRRAVRTTIRFRVDQAGPVSLVLYDLMGREISRLAEGVYGAGEHVRTVSSDGLATGMYVYRLQTARGVQSRVMSLLR